MEVPDHAVQEGRVNFLTRSSGGQWWVSTRDIDGQPRSGMPLDMFVKYYDEEHPIE